MNKKLEKILKESDKLYAIINRGRDGEYYGPELVISLSNSEGYRFDITVFCQLGATLKIHNKHLKMKKDIITLGYVYEACVYWDGSIHAYFQGEDHLSREDNSYYYCSYDFMCNALIAVTKISKMYFKNHASYDERYFNDFGYGEVFDKKYEIKEIKASDYDYKYLDEDK